MQELLIGTSYKSNGNMKEKILEQLKDILTQYQVSVLKLNNISIDEVLWIRDIFFTLDNTCVICNCTTSDTMGYNRKHEHKEVINLLESKYKLLYPPEDVFIEGGDIIMNGYDVFVGLNKRTNYKSLKFLQEHFPNYTFIPVMHDALHLDCVFNVVKDNTILYIHSKVIMDKVPSTYGKINVEINDINNNLVCNFLVVNKNTIIHTDVPENKVVCKILKNYGYNVHNIKYYNLVDEGGGIRCLTQWM
jgi:N-dimethylarginine dimethylaminohydrolase